jgi:hypothetical protein
MSLTKVTYAMIDGATANVLDFGAVGDGVANDTAAIQAAIDAVFNAGGGEVLAPAGVYLVTGLTLKNKVKICGDGQSATQLKRSATGGSVVTIANATSTTLVGLERLSILNTGGSTANDHGIFWQASPQGLTWSEFSELEVTASGDGIALRGTDISGAIWNTFKDVRVFACGNRGWHITGVSNQNTFINCAGQNNASHGMEITLGTVSAPQNITLINFSAEGNGTSALTAVNGLRARGVAGLLIDNLYGENNGPDSNLGAAFGDNSAHIWLQDCSGVEIRSGTFNKANYAILLTSTLATISGCNFYELGTFTNRKFSIGYQINSRIELGPNRFPSATVPMLNDASSDPLALTGIAPQTASTNIFNSLVASRKFFVATGDPATLTADVGDFAVARTAASGAVDMWRQVSTGVWRPIAQSVRLSTTANRPTLRAQDIGVMYMDTTLAAAGKPIWWNGTAWVDATGATV